MVVAVVVAVAVVVRWQRGGRWQRGRQRRLCEQHGGEGGDGNDAIEDAISQAAARAAVGGLVELHMHAAHKHPPLLPPREEEGGGRLALPPL